MMQPVTCRLCCGWGKAYGLYVHPERLALPLRLPRLWPAVMRCEACRGIGAYLGRRAPWGN